jgi:hypothetical protein
MISSSVLNGTRHLTNSADMVEYNMQDYQVNLDLCLKLDLIYQMVAVCNITRCYIGDIMLSSTGAMAASALCSYALVQHKTIHLDKV